MAKSLVFLTLERLGQNHGKYHAGGHVLNADLRSRFCLVYFTFILFTQLTWSPYFLSAMDTNLVVAIQKTEDLLNVTVTLNVVTQMYLCANVHFRTM